MKFPAGDTYKFDLELNDDKIRGETLKTIPVGMTKTMMTTMMMTTTMMMMMTITMMWLACLLFFLGRHNTSSEHVPSWSPFRSHFSTRPRSSQEGPYRETRSDATRFQP